MKSAQTFRRSLTLLFLLSFAFSLPGPLGLIPSVEAASASHSARIIGTLKRRITKMRREIASLKAQLAAAKAQLAAAKAKPAPFIEMVKVGNPGNEADYLTGFGAVPYEYSIGKYEVTLAQYTTFLNSVAATEDTHYLYSEKIASDAKSAGIARSGTSGSFTYSVIGTGRRPVTFVNWLAAARFCNWLHNGRPIGAQTAATTERGAYTLDGETQSGAGIVLNQGAEFWIPSLNEWYKAAYHQPSEQGGSVYHYWLYPTRSNDVPGNTIGPLPLANHANFRTPNSFYSVTQSIGSDVNQNYLTAVGSYPGSASFYGTFDQGGNVFEWIDSGSAGLYRDVRGGSWFSFEGDLRSSAVSGNLFAFSENNIIGFRVASH